MEPNILICIHEIFCHEFEEKKKKKHHKDMSGDKKATAVIRGFYLLQSASWELE